MKNNDIRDYAKEKGVKLWQIAEHLGVTDATFSRWLRHELDSEKKEKIIRIIDLMCV